MKKFTFKKEERLRKKREFEKAFAEGKKISNRNLVIYIRQNESGFSRLGIVVSRKFGNAPRRNRFKRIIREIFRLNKEIIPKGIDIIVIPTKNTEMKFTSLKDAFIGLLSYPPRIY